MPPPTLRLTLARLADLDPCEHCHAYREDGDDDEFYLYHLCRISHNGTEKCAYPAKICRVKDEDELFQEYLQYAVDRAMCRITTDNLKEGNWKEEQHV